MRYGNERKQYIGLFRLDADRRLEVELSTDRYGLRGKKASATSGKWKSYLTYRNSGSISVGYLVMADTSALGVSGGNGVKDLLQAGNEYTLVFKSVARETAQGVQGTYILKTVRIDAQFGNLVQGAFHFVLNGALAAGSD